MINSPELTDDKCFLEYPDGRMEIVQLNQARTEFITVEILSPEKADEIRTRFNLI
jgi:hypothetical protein